MAKMLIKTRNNDSSKGKPRVYFTCHPEDFDRYFEKIREDIFTTHDVAFYYTEDMTENFDPQHLETDLGQMNLVVVPVTWKLLSKPNRAMDADIAYAKENNIPILPFMMEEGIDEFYSRPEKFGQRQYLSPDASDLTAIRYEDKLKKYLESVLISDEMAQRVRKAFDAYIFLSYRKKDRKYANELMKLIHRHPECRDIAIWYDEFLTPGESFEDNIKKALENSRLFALLVTPNLLEEPEGKPNFVMGEEYPAAVRAEKAIVPAQMVPTDRKALEEKFPDIPACSDPRDEATFKERLLQSLQKIAISANNDDPEHNFLIGLAYLEGIDVEVNRERGIALITGAAEAGLPEAMEKLTDMYCNGSLNNYPEAVKWARKLYHHYLRKYGVEHPNALTALGKLAHTYYLVRDHAAEIELRDCLYQVYLQNSGEQHMDTLAALHELSKAYDHNKEYEKALPLAQREYELRCQVQQTEAPEVLNAMMHLAEVLSWLKEYRKAIELLEDVYPIKVKQFGETSKEAQAVLRKIRVAYHGAGDYDKSIDLSNKAMSIQIASGDIVPRYDLMWLAASYSKKGDHKKAYQIWEQRYHATIEEYGETSSAPAFDLQNMVYTCIEGGDYQKAIELGHKCHEWLCRTNGEGNMATLNALAWLAYAYAKAGDYAKAAELFEQEYTLRCLAQGQEHAKTLSALDFWAWAHRKNGDYAEAVALHETLYETRCRVLGPDHKDTQEAKTELDKSRKALEEST